MQTQRLFLKKGEDRRVKAGHPWIFSNEIATDITPLKSLTAGQEVTVYAHDGTALGVGYANPHSLITARILSRQPKDVLDEAFFIKRLQYALSLREDLYNKPFYRWVFSEGDGLPGLVVDRFGPHLVVQLNTAGMELKKGMLTSCLTTVLPDTQSILLRNDSPIREQEGLTTYIEPTFGHPPDIMTLEENQVYFTIPLSKGQKTGWFFDHRDNRQALARYVKGKRVLDVFSYLGGFGIQAAVFGAAHVDCVEASASACTFIKQNAVLNHVDNKVNVLHQDAFDALKSLLHAKTQYDVIILDPPAFVKRQKDRHEGLLAYQRINETALKLLKEGGILVSCSCSMHVSMEDLTHILQRAATKARCHIQLLEHGHQGMDHPIHIAVPETNYLKAIVIRKLWEDAQGRR